MQTFIKKNTSAYGPWPQTLVTAISLVLIMVLSKDLADFTWTCVAEYYPKPFNDEPQPNRPISPKNDQSTNIHAEIAHLFGKENNANKTQKASAVTSANLQKTKLNLTLLGILFSDSPTDSMAIILNGHSQALIIQQGDFIENAEIVEIIEDGVIIHREGRREILRLPKDDTTMAKNSNMKPGDELQQKVTTTWAQFQEKPEEILKSVDLAPAYRDGKLIGVILNNQKDSSFLDTFGLKSGDIVTWVNGTELTDALTGMKVLGSLSEAKQLKFRVLRNNDVLSFDFAR